MNRSKIKWYAAAIAVVIMIAGGMYMVHNAEKVSTSSQQEVYEADQQLPCSEEISEADSNNETVLPTAERISVETENAEETVTKPEEEKSNAPVILEVIEEDADTAAVIMAGENGEEAKAQVGVVEVGETVPPIEESSDSDEIQNTAETKPASQQSTEPHKDNESVENETTTSENTGITTIIGPDESISYLKYEAMSAQEQTLFYYSFANAEAFTEWYNNAKAEYEASIDKVYINADGSVDAG